MKGYEYITAKQIEWANNHGISLIGSQVDRGRLSYVRQLDENLFQPLLPEVREAFVRGRGDELGLRNYPGKMQAVHSSSALGVNVFQHWLSHSEVPVVAAACGLCRSGSSEPRELRFEDQYPVNDAFKSPPHIDVVIHNHPDARIQRLAIECKFSEAYGSFKHPGIKEKYLAECGTLWDGIPNLRLLAEALCPDDTTFQHLHAAQLIKHILGLKRALGCDRFRLLYLWYDVLGEEGSCHRDEVEEFGALAKTDGVLFHSLTFQDLICRLASRQRSRHEEYVRYLTERYL